MLFAIDAGMTAVADGVVLDGGFGAGQINVGIVGVTAVFDDAVFQARNQHHGLVSEIDALPVAGSRGCGVGCYDNRLQNCALR